MSLYAELRGGPVRAWAPHRSRPGGIYARMERERRRRANEATMTYNRPPGERRTRPSSRDRKKLKKKLDAEKKADLEKMEKEMKEEEEKNSMSDERVEELKKTILMVDKVDYHVEKTTVEHFTDMYDCTEGFFGDLVVRRGQEFPMTLTFQRPWSGKQDDLYIVFKIGEDSVLRKDYKVKMKLEEGRNYEYKDGKVKTWGARILDQHENSLTISVYSPPQAIIGNWETSIITEFMEEGKKKSVQYKAKDVIIILNPWCKDDLVYMESQNEKDEYVSNEFGCVFKGSHRSISPTSWLYGQFQENVLDISIHLLRKAFDFEISPKMGDPIQIARALSRIINACDDDGVLVGNWSGNYEGGSSPMRWKGSVPILYEYDATDEPVKYGQCWVFSHLLTTVARALGFPCRSVTNFSSSHDTNNSMTIDKYIDDEGNPVPGKGRDSIWNFHVWNEVWIRRPDLNLLMNAQGKYDGWHAIDATPQEASDNVYQCGPSPVAAILCGDVHVGYDTKFIFAEVNADICYWRQDGEDLTLADSNSHSVGKKISTKVPNGEAMDMSFFASDEDNRLDITRTYKHPEGSVAERESMMRALSGTTHFDHIFTNVTGIEIKYEEIKQPKLGEDITTVVKVTNSSQEERSVRLKLTVRPMTYWGEVIGTKLVTTDTFSEKKIQAKQSETFELLIKADQYLEVCDEHLSMSILAMAVVRDVADHQNRVYASDDIKVQSAVLQVQGPKEPVSSGEIVELEVKCTNPTNKTLTKCQLEIEGGIAVEEEGFEKKHAVYRKKIDNIKPKETLSMKVKVKPNVKPSKSREREVDIGLTCKELPDFEGGCIIKLKKK